MAGNVSDKIKKSKPVRERLALFLDAQREGGILTQAREKILDRKIIDSTTKKKHSLRELCNNKLKFAKIIFSHPEVFIDKLSTNTRLVHNLHAYNEDKHAYILSLFGDTQYKLETILNIFRMPVLKEYERVVNIPEYSPDAKLTAWKFCIDWMIKNVDIIKNSTHKSYSQFKEAFSEYQQNITQETLQEQNNNTNNSANPVSESSSNINVFQFNANIVSDMTTTAITTRVIIEPMLPNGDSHSTILTHIVTSPSKKRKAETTPIFSQDLLNEQIEIEKAAYSLSLLKKTRLLFNTSESTLATVSLPNYIPN